MAFRTPLVDIPRDLAKTVGGVLQFKGRSTRTEVWTYLFIGNLLVGLIKSGLVILTGEAEVFGPTQAGSFATLAFLAPLPALMARRLHDIGRSGWLFLPILVSMVVAALTEGAQPNLVWVEKSLSGEIPILLVIAGILFLFVVSLLPPQEKGDGFAPDPRLQRS